MREDIYRAAAGGEVKVGIKNQESGTKNLRFLVPENSVNGENIMSRQIKSDKPFGKLKRVKDLLPPPSELVPKEENVRITLALSRESVDFFKQEAELCDVPY